ncbi:MAG: hypothetical protein ACRDJC_15985, partial [Thermomicrobiales bacterium]
MDGNRFDEIAKSVAAPATRRTALGALAASTLFTALGLKRVPAVAQEDAQEEELTCVLDFAATVRQGPSTDQPAGTLRGELSFGLSNKGNLEDASLTLADGSNAAVVGQATGHSLQLRIQLGSNQSLVAIGVGEREIADCQGAIDGLATGPGVGDLGDWHAAVLRQSEATEGATSAGQSQGGQDRQGRARADRAAGQSTSGRTAAGSTPTPNPAGPTGPSAALSQCASGLRRCGSACVDLQTDMDNCGACGAACESGLVAVACRQGVCERADCPPGQTYCG